MMIDSRHLNFLKKRLPGGTCFLLAVYLCWPANALGEYQTEIREFGAYGFKNNSDDIKSRNQRLEEENLRLRRGIDSSSKQLSIEQKIISRNKGSKISPCAVFSPEEVLSLRQHMADLNRQLVQFKQENVELDRKISNRLQTLEKMQKKIDALRIEDNRYQSKLGLLSDNSLDRTIQSRKIQLLKLKKNREAGLKELERTYKGGLQKQEALLKPYKKIEEDERILKEDINSLKEDFAGVGKDIDQYKNEMASLQSEQDAKAPRLNVEIADLKTRQSELEKILIEARSKLSGRKVDLTIYDPDKQQLLKNLDVLRKENSDLYEQYLSLEKTYRELDGQ